METYAIIFVRIKIKVEKHSLESDTVHEDDQRPSHCFMQRQYLNHHQLTQQDFLNILAVCQLSEAAIEASS